MSVLVDTSVWIRFLSNRVPYASRLDELLGRDDVSGHDFVYGELLIGDKGGRKALLGEYERMDQAPVVPHADVVAFVRDRSRDDAEQTLLDLLADGLPAECLARLTIQHRMVKPIGDLISHCFYGDELESSRMPSDQGLRAVLARPVTWVSTSGVHNRREEATGSSFANQAEIRAIAQLLQNVDKIAQRSGKVYSVAILSGYAGQVIALQRQIGAKEIAWPSLRVEVNTVDAFQGREADIAIYSITRSNAELRVGFLSEQKRLNVALWA